MGMDGTGFDDLIKSEEERKKLFGLVPQEVVSRQYFQPQDPGDASARRRGADLQLLDVQSRSSYPAQSARSRFDAAEVLRMAALTVRNTFQRAGEAIGPVPFTPYGYESTWMTDIKVASGYARTPYNVRPGMAMAMGQESLYGRISRVPGVATLGALPVGAFYGGSAAAGAIAGAAGISGFPASVAGIAGGLVASQLVTKFSNPALQSNITSYDNWLQQVGYRLAPGPTSTMTGVGFTAAQRGQISYAMATAPMTPGVTREMVDVAAQGGLQAGMFQGVQGVQGFTKRFDELVKTVSVVSKSLNQSLQGAMSTINQLQAGGMTNYQQIQGTAGFISSAARTSGLDYQQITNAATVGSQMARAAGMPGVAGITSGIQSMWQAQAISRGGLMTPTQISQAGGVTGIASALAYQSTVGMMNTEVTRLIGAAYQPGGKLSREILDRYVAGGITSREIGNLFDKNVMANKTVKYEFANNLPKLIGALDPIRRNTILMTGYQRMAEKAGIDTNNVAALTGFMRQMGVKTPEALIAASKISPQQMYGTIHGDMEYQQRLDYVAQNSLGAIIREPFRAFGRYKKWRARDLSYWSQMQYGNLQDVLTRGSRQEMGVYDTGMEEDFEIGSPEWARMFGYETSTTLNWERSETYETAAGTNIEKSTWSEDIRPSRGPRGEAYFRGRATSAASGQMFRNLSGVMSPLYAEGWKEMSGMVASLTGEKVRDLRTLRTGEERLKVSANTREKLRKFNKGSRFGMANEKWLRVTAPVVKGALGLGGALTGLSGKVDGLYHRQHLTRVYEESLKFKEVINDIARDQGYKNFDMIKTERLKERIVDLAQESYNVDALKLFRDDEPLLTERAAKEKKEEVAEGFKRSLENNVKGKRNQEFMKWAIRGDQLGRVIKLSALINVESDADEKKRLNAKLGGEVASLVSSYEKTHDTDVNFYEIFDTITDRSSFSSPDGNRAGLYLHTQNVEYNKHLESQVPIYASKLIDKYAEKEGKKAMTEMLIDLSTGMPPKEVLEKLDVSKWKGKRFETYADKPMKKIAALKEGYDRLSSYEKIMGTREFTKKERESFTESIKKIEKETGYIMPGIEVEGGVPGEKEYRVSEAKGVIEQIYKLQFAPGGKTTVTQPGTVGEAQATQELYDSVVNLKASTELLHEEVKKIKWGPIGGLFDRSKPEAEAS